MMISVSECEFICYLFCLFLFCLVKNNIKKTRNRFVRMIEVFLGSIRLTSKVNNESMYRYCYCCFVFLHAK